MPLKVIDVIKPNGVAIGTQPSPFATVEDIDILGGFQVQATDATRNAIPAGSRKQGMLVYVIADATFYQLAGDLVTWNTASFGGDVTLGGDVTGPSAGNAVVTLTGSGGIVIATAKLVTHGRRLNTTSISSGPYNILSSDDVILVGSLGSALTINLPSTPTAGDIYTIKDSSGSAGTHSISISGNGHNIDGSSAFVVLSTNYQMVQFIYNSTQWNLI